jgi:hypothetical protein
MESFIALWYRKEKGEGGIFKNEHRLSNTVCIGSRDSYVSNLGGGVSLASISNIC